MSEIHPLEPIPNPLRDQPDFAVPPDVEAEIDELITHYPQEAERVADAAARGPGALRLRFPAGGGVDCGQAGTAADQRL